MLCKYTNLKDIGPTLPYPTFPYPWDCCGAKSILSFAVDRDVWGTKDVKRQCQAEAQGTSFVCPDGALVQKNYKKYGKIFALPNADLSFQWNRKYLNIFALFVHHSRQLTSCSYWSLTITLYVMWVKFLIFLVWVNLIFPIVRVKSISLMCESSK